MPALPLHTAGPYVAAAYIVFVALILLYVAIMAGKLSRIERELGQLIELAQRRGGGHDEQDPGAGGAPPLPGGRQAP
jgi:CcmD family protein